MKLRAEIESEGFDVETDLKNSTVRIEDRVYDGLTISHPEPNVILIKHKNRVYEAVVAASKEGRDTFEILLGGKARTVTIQDPRRLGSGRGGDDHGDGLAEVKSAMPGKVVRILVEDGATVAKGEGVVVVEAMKMQNELKSPKVGKVTGIKAVEGQTVNAGDVLLVIE